MQEFADCFRKQFILQQGKFGKRKKLYYAFTDSKKSMGLKTDLWVMIVFIICAEENGFNLDEIREELCVKPSMIEILKDEIPNILSKSYSDKKLQTTINNKIKLVRSSVSYYLSSRRG